MIVQPLAQVAIFALVLSSILAARMPDASGPFAYVIFLLAGTLCWSLFAEVLTRSVAIFVDNGNLIKKIAFPRVSLPLIVAGVALANNAVLFLVIVCGAIVLGHPPGIEYLWLPLLTLLTLALASGLGIILGTLNVFARDTAQAVPVFMQALYWLTPIVYVATILPERFAKWLSLNPLAPLVAGYQSVVLYNRPPDWMGLVPVAILSVVLLAAALGLFRRASGDMPDVL